MSLKKVAVAAVVAAVGVGFGVGSAGAVPPDNSYLCYSSTQTDPGVWTDSPIDLSGGLGGNVSAAQLLTRGYWLPWAERTVPTKTQLAGGWYLDCNLKAAAGVAPSSATTMVGGSGETVSTSIAPSGTPGYYPMAP